MQHMYAGNELGRVVEVSDVLAVLLESTTERCTALGRFGTTATQTLAQLRHPSQVTDSGIQAFEQAGWLFVQPLPEVRRAFEGHERVAGVSAIGKVYRQADGRMLVDAQWPQVRPYDHGSPHAASSHPRSDVNGQEVHLRGGN